MEKFQNVCVYPSTLPQNEKMPEWNVGVHPNIRSMVHFHPPPTPQNGVSEVSRPERKGRMWNADLTDDISFRSSEGTFLIDAQSFASNQQRPWNSFPRRKNNAKYSMDSRRKRRKQGFYEAKFYRGKGRVSVELFQISRQNTVEIDDNFKISLQINRLLFFHAVWTITWRFSSSIRSWY